MAVCGGGASSRDKSCLGELSLGRRAKVSPNSLRVSPLFGQTTPDGNLDDDTNDRHLLIVLKIRHQNGADSSLELRRPLPFLQVWPNNCKFVARASSRRRGRLEGVSLAACLVRSFNQGGHPSARGRRPPVRRRESRRPVIDDPPSFVSVRISLHLADDVDEQQVARGPQNLSRADRPPVGPRDWTLLKFFQSRARIACPQVAAAVPSGRRLNWLPGGSLGVGRPPDSSGSLRALREGSVHRSGRE